MLEVKQKTFTQGVEDAEKKFKAEEEFISDKSGWFTKL